MQQHPVPQHISSYEFKLVGDMTLKQFFQLAGGVLIALLFYAAALPDFIKWPFILFFSLLGTALAFLPFEERPLSTWIFAFFKAVYSPTKYVWTKGSAEEIFPKDLPADRQESIAPAPKEEHLSQVPQPEQSVEFEQKEASFVQKVTEMFQVSPVPDSNQTTPDRVVLKVEEIKNKQEAAVPEEIIIPRIEPIKMEAATPVFTSGTTPPAPAENPNTIVGQVIDHEGKIIDGAILEIQDSNNLPVRALKSNKAGHFLTVTPLPDGEYVITTEKEGFEFLPIKFIAKSSIIPPILIRAK